MPIPDAPQITAVAPMREAGEILYRYLSGYFDGGTHDVNAADPATSGLDFPLAKIYIDDVALPLADPETVPGVKIHGVLQEGRKRSCSEPGAVRHEVKLTGRWMVTAPKADDPNRDFIRVAGKAAGLLELVMSNSGSSIALDAHGLRDTEVQRSSTAVPTPGQAAQRLITSHTLVWSSVES